MSEHPVVELPETEVPGAASGDLEPGIDESPVASAERAGRAGPRQASASAAADDSPGNKKTAMYGGGGPKRGGPRSGDPSDARGGGTGGRGGGSSGGGGGRDGGGGDPGDGHRHGDRDWERLLAYPIATQIATGPVVEASISQRLWRELRHALGPISERPTYKQLRGFLDQRTETRVVNGTELMRWRDIPAGTNAVSTGGLVGEQAALVSFAAAQRDAVVPIVETLEPLTPAYDPEVVAARRRILVELVTQAPEAIAAPGGYSTLRMASLHAQLADQVERWGRAIGAAKDDGEPDRLNAQTAEEGGRIAQYQTVRMWVGMLREQLGNLGSVEMGDLASGFHKLEQALRIVAADVANVRNVCDRFGLSDAELDLIDIHVRDRASAHITLGSALRWIEDTAAVRLPALIDAAGRPALALAAADLSAQQAAIDALLTEAYDETPDEDEIELHVQIKHELNELRAHLKAAEKVATNLDVDPANL